jgi:hypothetical protein
MATWFTIGWFVNWALRHVLWYALCITAVWGTEDHRERALRVLESQYPPPLWCHRLEDHCHDQDNEPARRQVMRRLARRFGSTRATR